MGCNSSKEVEEKPTKHVRQKIISPRKGKIQKLEGGEQAEDIINSFNFITEEVDTIVCPPGMVPIACLSADAFCVCTSNLFINENEETDVQLPIIAASISRLGRIACFGHIKMLEPNYFLSKDTTLFYQHLFIWLTSKQILISNVLILDVQQKYAADLHKQLRSLGFNVDFGSFEKSFDTCQLIIISSDLDTTDENIDKLRKFSENGGAIACFYAPSQDLTTFPINTFLQEYGLAFMTLSISSETSKPVKVKMPYSYDQVKDKCLPRMPKHLENILSKSPVPIDILDDYITELRYILSVSTEDHLDTLSELRDIAFTYLKNRNYMNDNNELTPDMTQSILIVLIIDINQKLPISKLNAMPDCSIFPGIGKPELKDHKLELTILDQNIISTGLWLPAGQLSTITVDEEISTGNELIMVQIGAHTESLIAEMPPWKRWPQVVTAYKLEQGTTQVYSQFGGIVYITASDAEKRKVTFKFRGFARHPRAIEGKPEKYQQTKNFDIPWSEIQCGKCIVTLPTKTFLQITDMEKTYRMLNGLIKLVADFCHYPVKRPFRIVFDVQTPENKPVPSYPIFLPESDMNDILFQYKKPSVSLYKLFYCIGYVSIPEGKFDSNTEQALAYYVAAQIMSNVFNGLDVENDPSYPTTQIFLELWHINKNVNSKAVPELIRRVMESSDTVTYQDDIDKWSNFIRDLSNIAERNFTPAFEVYQRIPKNIISDVQRFPEYKGTIPMPQYVMSTTSFSVVSADTIESDEEI